MRAPGSQSRNKEVGVIEKLHRKRLLESEEPMVVRAGLRGSVDNVTEREV
jgi:hypothetical protein